jgi:hypothetical protein
MKLDKYIHIGDFDKTIDVNSPIYGEYKMTKVVTIDLIKACENMKLGPVHDFYYKFRNEVVTCKSISLETKRFGDQNLSNFELYVPILEDNLDWEVPEGGHSSFKKGKLPIGYKKEYIEKLIKEI